MAVRWLHMYTIDGYLGKTPEYILLWRYQISQAIFWLSDGQLKEEEFIHKEHLEDVLVIQRKGI